MKTIKVFIASSEELKPERDKLLIIEKTANRQLKHLGIEIDIEEWEYMDSSVGEQHKQEDYNAILRTCDICCLICWQEFGKYTEYEFQTAYEEMCKGQNPRKIYVYFKHPGQDSPELKEFKGKLGEIYGHFPNMFESPEEFGLHFSHILYGEALKFTKNIDDASNPEADNDNDTGIEDVAKVAQYTVKNSHVELDGECIGDFLSFPFAKNNLPYRLLRHEVELLEKQLPNYQESMPNQYPVFLQELSRKRTELQCMECYLLQTYCSLTQFLSDHVSSQVREVFRRFEKGEDVAIDQILENGLLQQSYTQQIQQFEETQSRLLNTIAECKLKIKLLSTSKETNWFQECVTIFEMTKKAIVNRTPDSEYASFLTEYAVFLQVNGQFDDNQKKEYFNNAEKLFQEARIIWDYLCIKDPDTYRPEFAFFLNKYAILQKKLGNRAYAVELYTEAIEHYTILAEIDAETFLPIIAQIRGNRALVYKLLKETDSAIQEYIWVIEEYKRLEAIYNAKFTRHIARNLQNLGILYKDDNNIEKAIETLDETYNLYSSLAEKDPNTFQYNLSLVLRNKAQALNKAQKYDDAQKQAIESSRIMYELLQRMPNHTKAIRKQCLILSELSLYSTRIGKYKEAEQYILESIAKEQDCQLFKGQRAAALKNLGVAVLLQGNRYSEAEKCLLEAAQMKKATASSGTWKETIVKDLEKLKTENLVEASKFADIDKILKVLNTNH